MLDSRVATILPEIPSEPGIYLYYNRQKELIYIGKATNLKSRVRSYFSQPLKNPRPIEFMIHEVVDIKWKVTDSVLEAIILEGNYIKSFKPKYNVEWKDDKSWNYIVISKDEYPRIETMRAHEMDQMKKRQLEDNIIIRKFGYVFGPYPGLKTREMIGLLKRLFFISSCQKNKQIAKLSHRPCLYYEMGQCLGVCTGEISPSDYRKKVVRPLVVFLRGNKKGVIRQFEKQMKLESKKEYFEEAGRLRNQINALQRIQDIALLNKSFIDKQPSTNNQQRITKGDHWPLIVGRIEGYDISNLGSTGKVGSMVVFDAHGPVKSEYRKFKIKTVEGQSDVDCLGEVLQRRLKHTEWKIPNLILVDGGKPQLNRALQVLREYNIDVPVIGIAKGPERKKNEFIYIRNTKNTKLRKRDKDIINWINGHRDLLIRVRDEAHRFAISYQKKLRRIKH